MISFPIFIKSFVTFALFNQNAKTAGDQQRIDPQKLFNQARGPEE